MQHSVSPAQKSENRKNLQVHFSRCTEILTNGFQVILVPPSRSELIFRLKKTMVVDGWNCNTVKFYKTKCKLHKNNKMDQLFQFSML